MNPSVFNMGVVDHNGNESGNVKGDYYEMTFVMTMMLLMIAW